MISSEDAFGSVMSLDLRIVASLATCKNIHITDKNIFNNSHYNNRKRIGHGEALFN